MARDLPVVRHARPEDRGAVVRTLARAFERDAQRRHERDALLLRRRRASVAVHVGDDARPQHEPVHLAKFTNVWVGWKEYQTSTETFDMRIDEVAIDPQQIGCVL